MATIFQFQVAKAALSVYWKAYLWLKNLMKSTYYGEIYLMFKCVHCHREESSLKLVVVWLHYPDRIGLLCFTRLISHLSSCEIIFAQKCLLSSSDRKVSQSSMIHIDPFVALLETSSSYSGFLFVLNLEDVS